MSNSSSSSAASAPSASAMPSESSNKNSHDVAVHETLEAISHAAGLSAHIVEHMDHHRAYPDVSVRSWKPRMLRNTAFVLNFVNQLPAALEDPGKAIINMGTHALVNYVIGALGGPVSTIAFDGAIVASHLVAPMIPPLIRTADRFADIRNDSLSHLSPNQRFDILWTMRDDDVLPLLPEDIFRGVAAPLIGVKAVGDACEMLEKLASDTVSGGVHLLGRVIERKIAKDSAQAVDALARFPKEKQSAILDLLYDTDEDLPMGNRPLLVALLRRTTPNPFSNQEAEVIEELGPDLRPLSKTEVEVPLVAKPSSARAATETKAEPSAAISKNSVVENKPSFWRQVGRGVCDSGKALFVLVEKTLDGESFARMLSDKPLLDIDLVSKSLFWQRLNEIFPGVELNAWNRTSFPFLEFHPSWNIFPRERNIPEFNPDARLPTAFVNPVIYPGTDNNFFDRKNGDFNSNYFISPTSHHLDFNRAPLSNSMPSNLFSSIPNLSAGNSSVGFEFSTKYDGAWAAVATISLPLSWPVVVVEAALFIAYKAVSNIFEHNKHVKERALKHTYYDMEGKVKHGELVEWGVHQHYEEILKGYQSLASISDPKEAKEILEWLKNEIPKVIHFIEEKRTEAHDRRHDHKIRKSVRNQVDEICDEVCQHLNQMDIYVKLQLDSPAVLLSKAKQDPSLEVREIAFKLYVEKSSQFAAEAYNKKLYVAAIARCDEGLQLDASNRFLLSCKLDALINIVQEKLADNNNAALPFLTEAIAVTEKLGQNPAALYSCSASIYLSMRDFVAARDHAHAAISNDKKNFDALLIWIEASKESGVSAEDRLNKIREFKAEYSNIPDKIGVLLFHEAKITNDKKDWQQAFDQLKSTSGINGLALLHEAAQNLGVNTKFFEEINVLLELRSSDVKAIAEEKIPIITALVQAGLRVLEQAKTTLTNSDVGLLQGKLEEHRNNLQSLSSEKSKATAKLSEVNQILAVHQQELDRLHSVRNNLNAMSEKANEKIAERVRKTAGSHVSNNDKLNFALMLADEFMKCGISDRDDQAWIRNKILEKLNKTEHHFASAMEKLMKEAEDHFKEKYSAEIAAKDRTIAHDRAEVASSEKSVSDLDRKISEEQKNQEVTQKKCIASQEADTEAKAAKEATEKCLGDFLNREKSMCWAAAVSDPQNYLFNTQTGHLLFDLAYDLFCYHTGVHQPKSTSSLRAYSTSIQAAKQTATYGWMLRKHLLSSGIAEIARKIDEEYALKFPEYFKLDPLESDIFSDTRSAYLELRIGVAALQTGLEFYKNRDGKPNDWLVNGVKYSNLALDTWGTLNSVNDVYKLFNAGKDLLVSAPKAVLSLLAQTPVFTEWLLDKPTESNPIVSTNAIRLFFGCFFKGLNESYVNRYTSTHGDTILRWIGRSVQDSAVVTVGKIVLDFLFFPLLTYHVANTYFYALPEEMKQRNIYNFTHKIMSQGELRNVSGDGNCLFHAIAFYTEQNAQKLRDLAIQYENDHPAEFSSFFENHDLSAHLNHLRRGGNAEDERTWGGQAEIIALERCLDRPIVVLHAQDGLAGISDRINTIITSPNPIIIYFNPASKHYSALLMRGESYFEHIYAKKLSAELKRQAEINSEYENKNRELKAEVYRKKHEKDLIARNKIIAPTLPVVKFPRLSTASLKSIAECLAKVSFFEERNGLGESSPLKEGVKELKL